MHLRLIGKRVVDFLLVIVEHYSLGYRRSATSECRLKIDVFEGMGPVRPKISGTTGRSPPAVLAVRKLVE